MFLFCFQYTLMTKHCRWKPVGKKTEFSMKSRSLSPCYYTRAHLYASSMRRAFSEGSCGALDAFGINRGKPLRRLHRLPHDGALRRETEVNPCPARRGALRLKSLGLASPLDKEQRAALKTERTRLEAEREALLPKIEEVILFFF